VRERQAARSTMSASRNQSGIPQASLARCLLGTREELPSHNLASAPVVFQKRPAPGNEEA
jgi:hypothetical protein